MLFFHQHTIIEKIKLPGGSNWILWTFFNSQKNTVKLLLKFHFVTLALYFTTTISVSHFVRMIKRDKTKQIFFRWLSHKIERCCLKNISNRFYYFFFFFQIILKAFIFPLVRNHIFILQLDMNLFEENVENSKKYFSSFSGAMQWMCL